MTKRVRVTNYDNFFSTAGFQNLQNVYDEIKRNQTRPKEQKVPIQCVCNKVLPPSLTPSALTSSHFIESVHFDQLKRVKE